MIPKKLKKIVRYYPKNLGFLVWTKIVRQRRGREQFFDKMMMVLLMCGDGIKKQEEGIQNMHASCHNLQPEDISCYL